MEEFTPETLRNYILSRRHKRDADEILERIEKKKNEKNTEEDTLFRNIAELDSQIRNNFAEIIRRHLKAGKKEELKKILLEHKQFIDNILSLLS